MPDSSTFLVSYAEELTDEDRVALDRPGFTLYPPGAKVSNAWFDGHERPAEFHARQWVRVHAQDSEEAMRLVTEVLGRKPEGLDTFQDMVSDDLRGRGRSRKA